jgi:hypothetical protein
MAAITSCFSATFESKGWALDSASFPFEVMRESKLRRWRLILAQVNKFSRSQDEGSWSVASAFLLMQHTP